ncbi:hypothetical protein SOCE26_095870 [Sorangium cellulosum]|uniref:Uncharacterized protein n=1 Tax=Sorangium cellulosum TaxID=56 RepID=A0A2L0F922_SORCE|nr:hypothetical protein [Sorangium cellulosum]AUX48060.1 hypothetical protein SOCE26_095870 [Sorangium cellulosum]
MTDREPSETAARPEPAETAERPEPGDAEPGATQGEAAGAEPRRRTKKRAKRRGGDADPGDGAPELPRDPELERLLQAFERGDYALVRADAGRLAKEAERAEVRRAARELLRRIEPDPLAVKLLLGAIALLVFLSFWYWSHSHAAP